MSRQSIVEFFASEAPHECGYCKTPNASLSNGMWAHVMTVQDYQDLIDRNWRRSGQYCYKPIMDRTCCPLYMIRCDAAEYAISRTHKKVIKKINNFLMNGVREPRPQASESRHSPLAQADSDQFEPAARNLQGNLPDDGTAVLGAEQRMDPVQLKSGSIISSALDGGNDLQKNSAEPTASKTTSPRKKARTYRMERKLKKLAEAGAQVDPCQMKKKPPVSKSLEDLLAEYSPSRAQHQLELDLVQSYPLTPLLVSTIDEEHRVYQRYQMAVHGDQESECTRSQFEQFLVKSPLVPQTIDGVQYGSFHYQYKLDGKVIAVEVIDILPNCISSKYFFYDPSYKFLNLGTYSALCAIKLTRELQQRAPSLKYYLMGYYAHSCQKMSYKAKFKPAYLLCPEAYTWIPLPLCVPKLDANKYSRLEPDARKDDKQKGGSIAEVACLFDLDAVRYADIQTGSRHDQVEVAKYARLVGKELSHRILLFRN